MNYSLLGVSKFPGNSGVNIGDYVQALAAAQYIPRINGFVDRDEELQNYHGERCKIIMNGWFMHRPQNWPPSESIEPLFVSFHLNSTAKDKLLSPESIAYFKKHQPIGCRDIKTMEVLNCHGIEAYFSGCLTLTLGEKYKASKRGDKTYIVDPHINAELNVLNLMKALQIIILKPLDIIKLYLNKQLCLHRGRNFITKAIKTALFYKEYTRVFSRELIMESIYVTQESDFYKTDYQTDFERLKEAERLIHKYAEASLVLTSRIHCALPCLGLGTPVIYLEKGHDTEESTCRFSGIKELFNVVKVDNGTLVPQFETTLPITVSNHPSNKDSWRNLTDHLIQRCRDFIINPIKSK